MLEFATFELDFARLWNLSNGFTPCSLQFSSSFRWLMYITTNYSPCGTVGIEFCLLFFCAQREESSWVISRTWGAIAPPPYSPLSFLFIIFSLDLVASVIAWFHSWFHFEFANQSYRIFNLYFMYHFPSMIMKCKVILFVCSISLFLWCSILCLIFLRRIITCTNWLKIVLVFLHSNYQKSCWIYLVNKIWIS